MSDLSNIITTHKKMSSVSYKISGSSNFVDDIMLDVDNKFSEWLLNQLNSRGWTQAELARRAGVSRTAISDVISDKHSAGFDLCLAISRALNLPPETVFRAAGLLPPVSPAIALSEEIMYLLQKLPVEEQERFLALLRFEVERQASKSPTDKTNKPSSTPSRATKPARSALKEK